MVSVMSAVLALYGENKEISIADLRLKFPKSALSTLNGALSVARNAGRVDSNPKKTFTKLTEEEIEKVIVKKLNKSADNANIRLAIEFLKIKRSHDGLDDDIDIEKYLKLVGTSAE